MDLEEADSYDYVKTYWNELNTGYKKNEISVDWEIHKQIYDQFHKTKGSLLKILVGFENRKCVGIVPFRSQEPALGSNQSWILGEEAIIAREYFTLPNKIHHFIPHFPQQSATDLSCFYQPEIPDKFIQQPGGIIDIKSSDEEYYSSLNSKKRYNIRRNGAMNSDVEVIYDNKIREKEIRELVENYIQYWVLKNASSDPSKDVDSREKINIDFYILRRAQELGKLVALYFYIDKKLVAANFSIIREFNRVDDYLCIREIDEKYASRGLGIYAIIKNIEHCRKLGIRYYDLSDFAANYKKTFINTDLKYYVYKNEITPMGDGTILNETISSDQLLEMT